MLFHTFSSQEERRNFGGSDFIELQYCKLLPGTEIQTIVSVDAIEHWKNDSLYVFGDDANVFLKHYETIFSGGIYNNGETGTVDLLGINYYSQEQTARMIELIKKEQPMDFQILLNWLENGKHHLGFYILGE